MTLTVNTSVFLGLGSIAGTYLQGNKIQGTQRLYHGDILTFGQCKLRHSSNSFTGKEEFKFECQQDGQLGDTLNDRATGMSNQTLEPKLNLVQEAQPYAQVNHLSYLQKGG